MYAIMNKQIRTHLLTSPKKEQKKNANIYKN